MKYSILGFNQERVLSLTKEVKDVKKDKTTTISIDVDDLLILSVIADISSRKSIRKVILEDGQYAWISYNVILEDLPILRIDKKQLRRRLDKLVEFELIDLKVERVNGSGTFVYIKIGKEYEALKYNIDEESKYTSGQKSTEGVDKNVYGCGQKCLPKDSLTKQEENNTEDKEERDKSLSKKDELFEECWIAYRRKGKKGKAKTYWDKLKEDERGKVLQHIKHYVSVNELRYQQDFERYLRDKTFESIVVKGNIIVYDPSLGEDATYHPFGNNNIMWNDLYNCWLSIDDFNGSVIDGYNDENRPDGAEIVLHNARGTITWSKKNKKWNIEMKSPW